MLTENSFQKNQTGETEPRFSLISSVFVVQPDLVLCQLLADLSPAISWGDRKMAANKLGNMRCSEALPFLLNALSSDPFWMVRSAIIQALEKIGDPKAIPALRRTAQNDSFQFVRSHAAKAIQRLS